MMEIEPIEMNTFYREMDWPSIPEDVCSDIFLYMRASPSNVREARRTEKKELFTMHDVPQSLIDWVENTLTVVPKTYEIRIQKSTVKGCPPHVDILRRSSFNCVLSDDNSVTNWYGEDDSVIHSVTYKKNVWYQHQSRVKHSVRNSSDIERIAVTIFQFELQESKYPDFTGDRLNREEVDKYLAEKRNNNELVKE